MSKFYTCMLFLTVFPFLGGCELSDLAALSDDPQEQPQDDTEDFAGPTRGILQVGEVFPGIECEGWIGGPQPNLVGGGYKLAVVDIWGLWCSEVEKTVPGLKALKRDYEKHGVVFVGITSDSQDIADQLGTRTGIDWPMAYGAPGSFIDAAGAANTEAIPGYETKPTIYVLGQGGRVVGSDLCTRMDHEDVDKRQVIALLRSILDRELLSLEADSSVALTRGQGEFVESSLTSDDG